MIIFLDGTVIQSGLLPAGKDGVIMNIRKPRTLAEVFAILSKPGILNTFTYNVLGSETIYTGYTEIISIQKEETYDQVVVLLRRAA